VRFTYLKDCLYPHDRMMRFLRSEKFSPYDHLYHAITNFFKEVDSNKYQFNESLAYVNYAKDRVNGVLELLEILLLSYDVLDEYDARIIFPKVKLEDNSSALKDTAYKQRITEIKKGINNLIKITQIFLESVETGYEDGITESIKVKDGRPNKSESFTPLTLAERIILLQYMQQFNMFPKPDNFTGAQTRLEILMAAILKESHAAVERAILYRQKKNFRVNLRRTQLTKVKEVFMAYKASEIVKQIDLDLAKLDK
jgi:hypothetical protein